MQSKKRPLNALKVDDLLGRFSSKADLYNYMVEV